MGKVRIIGAGIAGSEAAWQCANRGVKVELFEMRPDVMPPAHKTGGFAELVCSNSLKSTDVQRSAGLIKEELAALRSLILECALRAQIPGGASLIVDRELFSKCVTEKIESCDAIEIIKTPVKNLESLIEKDVPLVVATGPNTTPEFWSSLQEYLGGSGLYFFDATSPIIAADSIDKSVVFEAARYGKGGDEGYLNVPMNAEEYAAFRDSLLVAKLAPLSAGEDMKLFEGCLPMEELAARGEDAMRFGPLKPVGIFDPRDGIRPYAVLQLRQEDAMREAYSIVGFQTRLTYPEQERVIKKLPGMGNARFIRYGRMHKNNFIDSPRLLSPALQLISNPLVFFAGQITGLEGYQAAAATGLIAGINAARFSQGMAPLTVPKNTVIGEALRWMSDPENKEYRPTAPVYGMWKDVPKMKKQQRTEWYVESSRNNILLFASSMDADFAEVK